MATGNCYMCNATVKYDEYDPCHNRAELSDTGEKITLCDVHGMMIADATYDDMLYLEAIQ